MKNIEQKMIEEKRLLVGYKKIEPKKKLKIYAKDEDGPKYKRKKEFKKLIEKNKMKGKSKKIKK